MQHTRSTRSTRAIGIIALVLALCACGGDSRQKALSYSLMGLNAARDGFVTYDAERQQRIVAESTSLRQGKQALYAYRVRRQRVLRAFVVAYSALSVASLDPSVEMLAEALIAAKDVYKLVKAFTLDKAPVIEATPVAPTPTSPPKSDDANPLIQDPPMKYVR